MTYLLGNYCTKNYRNQTTTVNFFIVDGWVGYFFVTRRIYVAVHDNMTSSQNRKYIKHCIVVKTAPRHSHW